MDNSLKILIVLVGVVLPSFLKAQLITDEKLVDIQIHQNDSLVYKHLEDINVYPRKGRNLNYRRYSRIVAKVRKVYPLAKDAATKLEEYNKFYEDATTDRERRKYVKMVEKELFAEHEEQLRHFTITEGRYLMLLIDRETGHSSYSIIKEVKGGLTAVFWQGVAKIFRNDLKEEYDPVYKHYVIEQIVLMIDAEEKQKHEKAVNNTHLKKVNY